MATKEHLYSVINQGKPGETRVATPEEMATGLTARQAASLLGVTPTILARICKKGDLPILTNNADSTRGIRYRIPLQPVLNLKERIAKGMYDPRQHRVVATGWKRPDLKGRIVGIAPLMGKVARVEAKLDAVLKALGVEAPAAPATGQEREGVEAGTGTTSGTH